VNVEEIRELEADIADNLARVQSQIMAAAERMDRDPDGIKLIPISKTFAAAHVLAAYNLGLRVFGENRVGEAEKKIPIVAQALEERGDPPPDWHMVGHLQSRKSARALAIFDLLHSLDSLRLAKRLSRQAEEADKVMPILLEVNVSGEASKYGFPLSEARKDDEDNTAFLEAVAEIVELSHLNVRGLMTMAPLVEDPELTRPVFRRMGAWQARLRREFASLDWSELSMGMTNDFQVAIEEGATMIRLGRAIFGPRSID
jgi:hypothetical protein